MTVYFTKQFTNGTLKGISVNQSVSFAGNDAAFAFADLLRSKKSHSDVITRDRWIVTDLAFQKYDRS